METDATAARRLARGDHDPDPARPARRPWVPEDPDAARYLRWVGGAGALATALWLWLQLDLLGSRVFGNFYDIQARAFLDGHLDVPAGSLGNEAFAARGQEFLYNPPGPSLLRLPVFLVTDRFDGRLTTLSMLAAWMVTVVVVGLLVWRIRRLLRPAATLPTWEAAAYAGFLLAATAGTTVLYLASVPWVFHEAYSWAIATALGSAYGLIGVIENPTRGRIAVTGVFTLGAVLSRTPAGFACAAAVMGAAAWIWWRERDARPPTPWWRSDWWWIGVAGGVPVLIGIAVNWAKFRHPYLFPIEDQVFTGLSRSRRAAIEANGGDLFSPSLIWSTTAAYFRPDGIHVSSLFPFISLPAEPAAAHRGAVFDLAYRTGSIVSFMPGLVGLSVWGVVSAVRRHGPLRVDHLRLPLLGLALIPGGIMFGAYISHRYTAEFVPFLTLAGALGLVDVARRLGGGRADRRHLVLGALGLLAAFGIAANLAVAVSTQALANPGTVLADHIGRQERFSGLLGGDLDDHVVASVVLPEDAVADEIRIIGECQAVYVGTGEEFTPWSEAGVRPVQLRFTRSASVPTDPRGELAVAEFEGQRRSVLVVEREGDRYRVAVRGGGRDDEGPWFTPAPAETFTVSVGTDRVDDYVIGVDDDADVLRVAKENHDEDWYWAPNILGAMTPTVQSLAAEGLLYEPLATTPPAGCERRLDRYRDRTATSP